MNGPQDAHMRAAAAKIGLEPSADLGIGGVRLFLQQRLCAHHHAGNAIAALRGLRFDEGALDRRRLRERAEPLERGDLEPCCLLRDRLRG